VQHIPRLDRDSPDLVIESIIEMARERGLDAAAIVEEIRTDPVAREACIRQMILGVVEGVSGYLSIRERDPC
jgi:hypothetical protein